MQNIITDLNSLLPKKYSIIKYLDGGGQGLVFLGQLNGQDVAVKLYDPSTTEPERVEREIEFLKNSTHPNLVKIIASERINLKGHSCDVVFYEFIPGGNLNDRYCNSKENIDCASFLKLASDLSGAIEHMWESRMVHRDVKPANVLHDSNRGYVLIDLCFAKHLDRSTLTCPGGVLGTDGYKSPEQAMGRQQLTIHSDMFSLAITLYEIASTIHPFQRSQTNIMMYHSGKTNVESLSRYRADLPTKCISLIESMMARVSYKRPMKVSDEFKTLLEGICSC